MINKVSERETEWNIRNFETHIVHHLITLFLVYAYSMYTDELSFPTEQFLVRWENDLSDLGDKGVDLDHHPI